MKIESSNASASILVPRFDRTSGDETSENAEKSFFRPDTTDVISDYIVLGDTGFNFIILKP